MKAGPSALGHIPPATRRSGPVHLVLLGAVLIGLTSAIGDPLLSTVTLAGGISLVAASGLIFALSAYRQRVATTDARAIARVTARDASPCFTTNEDACITYQNDAATARFGARPGASLASVFGGILASPGAVIQRVSGRATATGAAQEDLSVRNGMVRLSAWDLGDNRLLWRLDEFAARTGASGGADGVSLPMLTVAKSGAVLHVNEALRRLVGGRPKTLDRIIADLPLRPGDVHRVSTETGVRHVTVIEVQGPAGRRELYLLPVTVDTGPVNWDMIDALPVPILKLARSGVVLMANRMAKELLRVQPGEETGFGSLVEGLGRPLADWVAEAADGRGSGRPEFLRAARVPQDTYIQVTLTGFEENGQGAVIAVLNDATELKTLEAQFVQSQKMQAIGQLAGGVAHDFNNLLTAISGHCDLLLLRRDPGDPDYADLSQIHQNANRAASLVGQLLAFSRKQNLRPEHIDLRETMGDLAHLLNRLVGEKIALTFTHDPDAKQVRADKRQFEQVMMNLVVNARDAMPDGGTIEVETRATTLATELTRDRAVVPPGEYVMIRVVDHGTGIDADSLQKVFEPFFTTKRAGEGTGLGLSTVYGIVKQTGGFIFADSEPGSGTAFTIYFPAQDPPAPEEATAQAEAPRTRSKERHGHGVILLVEDEAPVRAFASRALRLRGYTVIEAANAEEALEQLRDATLDVDVFVTDVIMPGMDGPTWVSEALRDRPDTRVVFVSGYAEESFAEGQARIPQSVFLPKPFSLSQLTETVQAQIH
ncbi:hybrid sensor histidine kinase/response regulator [Ovoidimarina sediminis]|uniref:hybrid sensor histidine kinase/response regulator n=1 Tax=Ovoidimarina sediminis TaxID=3079856 RepID=UPI003977A5CA